MTIDSQHHWIVFTLMMVMGSLAFHIFSRYAKGSIDPILAAVICNAAAFAVCGVLYALFRSGDAVPTETHGIWFSVLAGVFVGLANFAVFGMYKAGMTVSLSVPLTRTAVALGAVVLGILLFSEQLSLVKAIGVGLSIISIVLMVL